MSLRQLTHYITDRTKYGQINPYQLANFTSFPQLNKDSNVLRSIYNDTEQSEFHYDPYDAIRLIMGRHILNARRIYPNIRVIVAKNCELPIDDYCDCDPYRINIETDKYDIVIRFFGLF